MYVLLRKYSAHCLNRHLPNQEMVHFAGLPAFESGPDKHETGNLEESGGVDRDVGEFEGMMKLQQDSFPAELLG